MISGVEGRRVGGSRRGGGEGGEGGKGGEEGRGKGGYGEAGRKKIKVVPKQALDVLESINVLLIELRPSVLLSRGTKMHLDRRSQYPAEQK